MIIQSRQFIGSFNTLADLPKSEMPEFCFIGRSNVGKSSLINYITGKKDLAKVSSTPGKTQSFNYFLINKNWHLVDLPGYGYAKRSKTLRASWNTEMHRYFIERETLLCVFVLIDSRIPPQKLDLELIHFLGENEVPFSLVFTKADKREFKACTQNIKVFKSELLKTWEALPTSFITSSEEKQGGDLILEFIAEIASK